MIPSFFEDQIPIISLGNRELPLFYLWDPQVFFARVFEIVSHVVVPPSSHCNCLNPSSWLFNKYTKDEGNYALHWTVDYLKTETHLTVLKTQDNFLEENNVLFPCADENICFLQIFEDIFLLHHNLCYDSLITNCYEFIVWFW